ncbi:vitamin K epoxide reductase family protein [Nocardioides kribbensis]|uniref:Vitamin K epoxide reductase family protein n=1 Tax=Nocardioides kribbensis TaxID=305517 RepID=A0ABV1NT90_9ACTN
MTSALAPTGPASADVDAGVGPGVRPLAWLLLLGGVTGLLAAATLLVEKIALIADPEYVPSCSINPVLSCGSIMSTPQAELFGFPNPIIGVAAFPVLAATGAALLAGARLARWYWLGLQMGVVLGLAFVGWLVFQSLYRIGALCPYCMVVWAVVVPVAFYVSSFNLRAGLLGGALARSRAVRVIAESHVLVLAVVLVLVLVLVLHRFWSYWVTVL